MKYCSKCKETKELNQFGNNKSKPDGKQSFCKSCKVQQNNVHRSKYMHKYRLLKRYGLTVDQFDSMIEAQNNKCAICLEEFSLEGSIKVAPHVDHNHLCCSGSTSCGKCIRDLLCGMCNSGLAFFKDNSKALFAASHYINLHNISP